MTTSRRTAPRAKDFTSQLGWPARIDTAGGVTIFDSHGRPRAHYQGKPHRYPSPALPDHGEHPVTVGEEQVLLFNGVHPARRRRDFDGRVELGGRRYEFVHLRRWRTEVRRDGVLVARMRRRMGPRYKLLSNHASDEVDQLAAALGWHAVRPGRPGAISMLMSSF
jgi:hypothetical protein